MNVAWSSSTEGYNPSSFISGGWYNSELMNFPAYGQGNLNVGEGSGFNNWGHFSAVVWPETQKVGCAVAQCSTGAWKVHAACVYQPAGNMMGSFDKVKAPKGGPMVYPNGQTKM